jgi:exodeoxyribonuclease V gamma subunit
MRSVPHRVICLLGLDDGIFPRGVRVDGDDVLARDPAVGERDPRAEDRQLMLDAILAATEHLVITYTGADERTGALRPPAVPLGELLDALDDTAVTTDGGSARDHALVRHPLQPFDARNVTPGALGVPGPFTFDATALAGAQAATGTRRPPAAFLAGPLPPRLASTLDLADVSALLQRPAAGFLRQRLDVAMRYEESEPSDQLSVELDKLEEWRIGDRLLRDRLAGADAETCRQAEWRRGELPPGLLGERTLNRLLAGVEPLVAGSADLLAPQRRTIDVVLGLGDGRELRGTVAGVHSNSLVSVVYSKLAAGHRLQAWITLVALTAAYPDEDWTAITVGRGRGPRPAQSTLGPLAADSANQVLGQLLDLYDRGLREPLPLARKTSAAYAEVRHSGYSVTEAIGKARRAWTTWDTIPGEQEEGAHAQVWGSLAPLEVLLAAEPCTDVHWAGEPTRFGELALRLWNPHLADERIVAL